MTTENNNDKSITVFNSVLRASLSLPGAKIKRDQFLRKELSSRFKKSIVDRAITESPSKAGIDKKQIKKIAKGCIKYHRAGVSSVSFIAGLPGGWWIAGTVPADLSQFFWHVIVILQKLAYIHGWPELFSEKDEIDDETLLLLTVFIGVMFGANGAAKALGELAEKVAAEVLKRLPQKALTKYGIYRLAKEVAKWIGIKLTKETFARYLSKAIPVISGFISGGITWISFSIMSSRLRKHLQNLQLAS